MDGPNPLTPVPAIAPTPAVGAVPTVGRPVSEPAPLDAFSRRAGPDVTLGSPPTVTSVHAVFSFDPDTNEMRVSLVDGDGRLVRMIPPESVGAMLAAMASYRGR